MKKIIIVLSLVFVSLGFAQITDTGDKVGIGTTSPNAKLEVKRTGNTLGGYWTPNNSYLTLDNSYGGRLILDPNEIYSSSTLAFGSKSGDIAVFRTVSETSAASDKMIIKNNGNVGIGTSAPNALLELNANTTGDAILRLEADTNNSNEANNARIEMYQDGGLHGAFIGFSSDWGGTQPDNLFRIGTRSGGVDDFTRFVINPTNGNTGIGTTNPTEKLHISGNLKFTSEYNKILWPVNTSHPYGGGITADDGNYKRLTLYHGHSIDFQTGSNVHNQNNSRLYISTNGNIGIGTRDTKGFELGVQGKIAAEEVKVATYSNWSDFVFKNNYNLPTLKEVEQHIKEKGHLKDIPSAEEVKKDGFFLGEMDSKLLQKIEELTLYTIQQQKEIESLKKENNELKSLCERLAKIEKLLKQ